MHVAKKINIRDSKQNTQEQRYINSKIFIFIWYNFTRPVFVSDLRILFQPM